MSDEAEAQAENSGPRLYALFQERLVCVSMGKTQKANGSCVMMLLFAHESAARFLQQLTKENAVRSQFRRRKVTANNLCTYF